MNWVDTLPIRTLKVEEGSVVTGLKIVVFTVLKNVTATLRKRFVKILSSNVKPLRDIFVACTDNTAVMTTTVLTIRKNGLGT